MAYAIITLGGKQYRVQEGQRLLVDRLKTEEGKTFHPEVLLLGGDGKFELAPKSQVTARVVGSALGDKITIGKYKPKSGYRRKTGFRAKLSQIEIESIGGAAKRSAPAKSFTPSICGFESRPFRDEPSPFLCAIYFSSSADSSAASAPLRDLPERSCSSAASISSLFQPAAASVICGIVIASTSGPAATAASALAAGFSAGFSSAFSAFGVTADFARFAAPIDSISIRVSLLRWPVCFL